MFGSQSSRYYSGSPGGTTHSSSAPPLFNSNNDYIDGRQLLSSRLRDTAAHPEYTRVKLPVYPLKNPPKPQINDFSAKPSQYAHSRYSKENSRNSYDFLNSLKYSAQQNVVKPPPCPSADFNDGLSAFYRTKFMASRFDASGPKNFSSRATDIGDFVNYNFSVSSKVPFNDSASVVDGDRSYAGQSRYLSRENERLSRLVHFKNDELSNLQSRISSLNKEISRKSVVDSIKVPDSYNSEFPSSNHTTAAAAPLVSRKWESFTGRGPFSAEKQYLPDPSLSTVSQGDGYANTYFSRYTRPYGYTANSSVDELRKFDAELQLESKKRQPYTSSSSVLDESVRKHLNDAKAHYGLPSSHSTEVNTRQRPAASDAHGGLQEKSWSDRVEKLLQSHLGGHVPHSAAVTDELGLKSTQVDHINRHYLDKLNDTDKYFAYQKKGGGPFKNDVKQQDGISNIPYQNTFRLDTPSSRGFNQELDSNTSREYFRGSRISPTMKMDMRESKQTPAEAKIFRDREIDRNIDAGTSTAIKRTSGYVKEPFVISNAQKNAAIKNQNGEVSQYIGRMSNPKIDSINKIDSAYSSQAESPTKIDAGPNGVINSVWNSKNKAENDNTAIANATKPISKEELELQNLSKYHSIIKEQMDSSAAPAGTNITIEVTSGKIFLKTETEDAEL